MLNERAQQIVDEFFNALALVNLETCYKLFEKFMTLPAETPDQKIWGRYLEGILANEYHRDWAEGERIFTALLAENLGDEMLGRVLIALGRTYDYQGQWRNAIEAYKQCLAIYQQPDQTIDRVKVWKNLAISYERGYAQGEFSREKLNQGIKYCHLALESLQTIEHPNETELWLEATTWNTLGVIYRSQSEWLPATRCYERFLALAHSLDDPHSIGMASNNLGEVLQQQGPEKWPEARAAYLDALKAYRQFGDQYEQVDVLSNLGSLHEAMSDLEQALAYYDQAINIIESLRAGVSDEQARAGFFATTADTYAHAVRLTIALNQPEQAFHYMERARSRTFLDILAAGSPHLERERAAEVLTLTQVQNALPPDALLLEYFTMGMLEARDLPSVTDQTPYRHRRPPEKTYLFAVSGNNLEVFDLGLSPNAILPQRLDQVVEQYLLDQNRRCAYYETLIAPVKEQLSGIKRLYIVPHGPLHYIPFHLLETNSGRLLFDQPDLLISYAPSATILIRHCGAIPKPTLSPMLAVGYNGQGLLYAEEEARHIAALVGGRALTGPDSKKVAFFMLGSKANSLHLACHGYFDPDNPMASALETGQGETLTAQEIVDNLRLQAQIITLSACETGLSRVLRGDEPMGLTRAFIVAGAPAVVSTMWRVEEQSTRILMLRFYKELEQGLSPVAALKQAQQYLRKLTRAEVNTLLAQQPLTNNAFDSDLDTVVFNHPYFWAPFIVMGDFEPKSSG